MTKLLFVLLFTPILALAQINQHCPQFTVNGTPAYQAQPGDQELCKTNYALLPNQQVMPRLNKGVSSRGQELW